MSKYAITVLVTNDEKIVAMYSGIDEIEGEPTAQAIAEIQGLYENEYKKQHNVTDVQAYIINMIKLKEEDENNS